MKGFTTEKIAALISRNLIQLQQYFVWLMNKAVSGRSTRTLKTVCLVFSLLFTAWSSRIITDSLTDDTTPVKINHIKQPRPVIEMHDPLQADVALYSRLHKARLKLDSIRQLYPYQNNIQTNIDQRPGLYDSIVYAEQLYQLPLKK